MNVVFYERVEHPLVVLIVMQPQRWYVTDIVIGIEETPLDECSRMDTIFIEYHQLLILISVFFKDLLLNFEILFIEGLIRREISFGIEGDGLGILEVFLVGIGHFFGRGLGFFIGRS